MAPVVPGFMVQLRDRSDRDDGEVEPLARSLRAVAGVKLVVNRRLALARRVGADGFHAPSSELAAPDFAWRSAPAHHDGDVVAARDAGATAIFISPIFDVPNKASTRGLEALRRARALAPRCVIVALGGIDEHRAAACYEAGADGVAVMRALLDAPDPIHVAKCLVRSGG